MKRIILFGLLLCSFLGYGQVPRYAPKNPAIQHQSPIVWLDSEGLGRHVYAYFRRDFDLSVLPQEASINLFADSRYHLIINGVFVNFGPARFYPQHPEYDTYDIASYLKEGHNVIAVKVLANGMNTYQLRYSRGGFAAWGTIKSGLGAIELNTPGEWLCHKAMGYDQTAPKFSFACGAIDVYDAREDISGWYTSEIVLDNWQRPVPVEQQDWWAALSRRSIPLMTRHFVSPSKLSGVYELASTDEVVYSCRVKVPDQNRRAYQHSWPLMAYTYIYSPQDQEAVVGLWWGEFYLNGEKVEKDRELIEGYANRQNATFRLKRGWNYLFVSYGAIWGSWEFYMAMPQDIGLVLSPNKDKRSDAYMMTAGPFKREDEERLSKLSVPLYSPEDLPHRLSAGWQPQSRHQTANNPYWDMAWQPLGRKLGGYDSTTVENITIVDTTGAALVFDMDGEKLGRLFVEFEAPAGTQIDIAWEEDLKDGRVWFYKRYEVHAGSRYIAKGTGIERLETFKPHGLQFIQLNIKNNSSPVTIKRIGVIQHLYPTRQVGSFECSDPLLNAIWDAGYQTIVVCMEDVYTDPFRERGLYAGDLLPESLIGYVSTGDVKLLRRCLFLHHDMYESEFKPDVPFDKEEVGLLADYPLITLVNLKWYVDISNDWEFAGMMYDGYKHALDKMLTRRREDHLFDHRRVFIEWTQIKKDAQSLACMNALIAQCYAILADMAEGLGKLEDAGQYRQIAEETRQAVREKFWDEAKGAYCDGIDNEQLLSSYYPISSAWPSLWDVSTKEQEYRLSDFFAESLSDIGDLGRHGQATPYGGFYVLGALYKHGNAATAEAFMRKYWGNIVLAGHKTFPENFSVEDANSRCHGWSGGPTYYLSTQVLGVQLGFITPFDKEEVIIAPQAETIDWARGVVPHPKGRVVVDWEVVGDILFLNYQVPEGVRVRVAPCGRLAEKALFVNGEKQN